LAFICIYFDRIAVITRLAITAMYANRDMKETLREAARTIVYIEVQDPNHADAMKQVRVALRALMADANAKGT
jgi:hypothetical protein